jgi:X-Pro dipeptidyl-peptidase
VNLCNRAYKEFTLWPKDGTELKFDLTGTRISIPVVGGRTAFAKATGTK